MATRTQSLETSQPDSLHLVQCNFVLCPVVELGRSRRLMPGRLLACSSRPSFSRKIVMPVARVGSLTAAPLAVVR